MPVDCTEEGRVLRARVMGELDHHRAKEVMEELDRILDEREEEYTVCIPYTEGKFVSLLRENAKIIEEEYTENGTRLRVRSASQYKSMVKEYLE